VTLTNTAPLKGGRVGTLFWSAAGGLVLLGAGLGRRQPGQDFTSAAPGWAGSCGAAAVALQADRLHRARGDRAGAARHHEKLHQRGEDTNASDSPH